MVIGGHTRSLTIAQMGIYQIHDNLVPYSGVSIAIRVPILLSPFLDAVI